MNTTVRVAADRDVCIGAGMCVVTAPTAFDQDEEGIVVVLAPDLPDVDARHVVSLCPSGALRLIDPEIAGTKSDTC